MRCFIVVVLVPVNTRQFTVSPVLQKAISSRHINEALHSLQGLGRAHVHDVVHHLQGDLVLKQHDVMSDVIVIGLEEIVQRRVVVLCARPLNDIHHQEAGVKEHHG